MDRFTYCDVVCTKLFLNKICVGKKVRMCEYYPFSDKEKMKELLDAEMVLKARIIP